MAEAPYQRSRAALRKEFGSRAIDARTKYSDRDSTPSARAARFQQEGLTEPEAITKSAQTFRSYFGPQQQIQQAAPMFSRRAMQIPSLNRGMASPNDVRGAALAGGIGAMRTPYGQVVLPATPNPSSLLPPVGQMDGMADFMPDTTGPLSSFSLPRPSLLGRRPSFG
jgi:hypothetical protein